MCWASDVLRRLRWWFWRANYSRTHGRWTDRPGCQSPACGCCCSSSSLTCWPLDRWFEASVRTCSPTWFCHWNGSVRASSLAWRCWRTWAVCSQSCCCCFDVNNGLRTGFTSCQSPVEDLRFFKCWIPNLDILNHFVYRYRRLEMRSY